MSIKPTIRDKSIQDLVLSQESSDNILAALLIEDAGEILVWGRMGAGEAAVAQLPFMSALQFHKLAITYYTAFPHMQKNINSITIEFNANTLSISMGDWDGEDILNESE